MKQIFTREEVIKIITNIYKNNYDYPMFAWAEYNGFDREEAIRTATDEYVATSILLEENN